MFVAGEDGVDIGFIVAAALGGRANEGLTAACDGSMGHRVKPGENLVNRTTEVSPDM